MTTNDDPEWTECDDDHPASRLLHSLLKCHHEICAHTGITPWELCVVYANLQGIILGLSHDMPRECGLDRINELAELARWRFHDERAGDVSKATH